MSVVIGLVVHAHRREVFEAAASTITGVTLKWLVYRHDHEIRGLVRDLFAKRGVDGLLLGPLPFEEARDLLPGSVAVAVLQPSALDLALALSRARTEFAMRTPVSIDTFGQEAVDEVSEALELDPGAVWCLPYTPGQRTDEIIAHHREVLGGAGSGFVITMRMEVAKKLRGQQVPVLNSHRVPSTIRSELHQLALRIQSGRANASRFAAGVFLVGEQSRDVDLDRARVGLMNLLLNTPEMAEAWVENRGRRGLVVFAHKALFERITHGWRVLPPLGHAEELLGIRAAAGFGIGGSARTSVALAERAAGRAETEDLPSGYLIEDTGVIIGPMGADGRTTEFTYRDHGVHLEELAQRVGLSAATLSRLASIERGLAGRAIAPSDLANTMGITDPSGRRLIRKLHEHGLVTAEGTAQTHRKGRPTRLYRIRVENAGGDR